MNKTLKITMRGWFGWCHVQVFTKCFHKNLHILKSNGLPEKISPSDFWTLWPHTKHFVETFIAKFPWNAFRRNLCVEQFDGSSEKKVNRVYLDSDIIWSTPVENLVFTKYTQEKPLYSAMWWAFRMRSPIDFLKQWPHMKYPVENFI